MILIVKSKFDAAHKLDSLGENHKCSKLHGHTWQVVIGVEVFKNLEYDFQDVKRILNDTLPDHQFLNDFIGQEPTAENICKWLERQLKYKIKRLKFIEIWESEDCGVRLEIQN